MSIEMVGIAKITTDAGVAGCNHQAAHPLASSGLQSLLQRQEIVLAAVAQNGHALPPALPKLVSCTSQAMARPQ